MAAKRYNLPFKIMSASKLNKTKQLSESFSYFLGKSREILKPLSFPEKPKKECETRIFG